MECQFRNKKDVQCKNRTIGSSTYCHLKSHHNSNEIYTQTIDELRQQFELSTLQLDNFRICNVTSDGACAYRCMIRALYDVNKIYPITVRHESDYTDQLSKIIEENKKLNYGIETRLAALMQQIIREWIMENQQRIIENMDYSLENFIITCHELESLEEYNELYKIFAGEDDFVKIESGK